MITTLDVCKVLKRKPVDIYILVQEAKARGITVKKIGRSILWNEDLITYIEDRALQRGWIDDKKLSKTFLKKRSWAAVK